MNKHLPLGRPTNYDDPALHNRVPFRTREEAELGISRPENDSDRI